MIQSLTGRATAASQAAVSQDCLEIRSSLLQTDDTDGKTGPHA